METLKSLVEFMKSINTNGKWDHLTVENATKSDFIEMERDLNLLTDNGLSVDNQIERFFNALFLVKIDFSELNNK